MAVLHAEAAGDNAELGKPEALIQVPRVRVGRDDGVELQHPEAVRPALHKAVDTSFSPICSPRAARSTA